MIVTELLAFGKNKIKVYIDEEYVFWLYRNEIEVYGLFQDGEVSVEQIAEILKETVNIRVKKKALSILERADRTEAELCLKLKQAGYPEPLAQMAVSYVKQHNYMDDRRFTENYIRACLGSKSKRVILNTLMQKGIEKELIHDIFEQLEGDMKEQGENPEFFALQKEIEKRTRGKGELSREEKQKLAAALCRKGFSYDLIQKELSVFGFADYT